MNSKISMRARLAAISGYAITAGTTFEAKLSSGRTFRYTFDRSVSIHATDSQIGSLVADALKDKYRYCQWDRDHPENDSYQEIYDAMLAFLKTTCRSARDAARQSSHDAATKKTAE